jgi:hypothetical protein
MDFSKLMFLPIRPSSKPKPRFIEEWLLATSENAPATFQRLAREYWIFSLNGTSEIAHRYDHGNTEVLAMCSQPSPV